VAVLQEQGHYTAAIGYLEHIHRHICCWRGWS
jgi:hypothetical protein